MFNKIKLKDLKIYNPGPGVDKDGKLVNLFDKKYRLDLISWIIICLFFFVLILDNFFEIGFVVYIALIIVYLITGILDALKLFKK